MMVMDEVSAHNLFQFCVLTAECEPGFSGPWDPALLFTLSLLFVIYYMVYTHVMSFTVTA